MKRIFAFMLVIVVLSSVAVPAFAADSPTMLYNGVELPNIDNIDGLNSCRVIVTYNGEYVLYAYDYANAASHYAYQDTHYVSISYGSKYYKLINYEWVLQKDVNTGTSWPYDSVVWGNNAIKDIDFAVTEPVVPAEPEVPAVPDNNGGGVEYYSYNGRVFPALPTAIASNDHVVIADWHTDALPDGVLMWSWNGDYNSHDTYNSNSSINKLTLYTGSVTVHYYQLINNEWVLNDTADSIKHIDIFGDIIWTRSNITTVGKDHVDTGEVHRYGTAPVYVGTNPYCDGSMCALADMNFDDVCDTCGMPVAYNLRVTPLTYEFVIKHSDSLTLKYTYTETLDDTTFNAVYDDERITVTFDKPVDHYQYKLVDGEWEEYASYPNESDSHAMSLSETATILSSNLVVYDANGEVFFRNPLWMVMGQVAQREIQGLLTKTGGTMKILVVCGVGLTACLAVLSLFGKRSLIFRR